MKAKNTMKLAFASVVTIVALTGCGGGSGTSGTTTSASTGTFLDAPVQGLTYKTATQSGFTDSAGHFKYQAGEEVEFKLGNLSLGKGTADVLMTPYTISDDNDTATNIALLLQNFDGNRSNTQVLDLSKLKDYNFSLSDFNLSQTPATIKGKIDILFADNNFTAYRDDSNNTVMDATTVKTALDSYLAENSIMYDKKFTQGYLDNRVLWMTDDIDGIFSLTFHTNGQIDMYSVDTNTTEQITYTISVDGKLTIEFDPNGIDTHTITNIDESGIQTSVSASDGSFDRTFFYTKTAAESSIDIKNTKKFTEAYLNDKVLYAEYSDEPGSYTPYDFTGAKQTFTDDNPSSSTYQQQLEGYFTGDGMIVVKDGKLYEFTYNTVNGQPVYNDGINIYTVVSVDDTKVTTSMDYGSGTLAVYFYFNQP